MNSNSCIWTKYWCLKMDKMYRVIFFWWNYSLGNSFVHRLIISWNLLLSFFPYLIIGRINRRMWKLHLLHIFMKSQQEIRYILNCLLISLIFNVETSMKFGQVKPSLNRLIKNGWISEYLESKLQPETSEIHWNMKIGVSFGLGLADGSS